MELNVNDLNAGEPHILSLSMNDSDDVVAVSGLLVVVALLLTDLSDDDALAIRHLGPARQNCPSTSGL